MKDFSQVIGHREVIEHLQKGIQENKVSHAYIFAGEKGSGKRMLADIFASTLQCQKGGIEPCGTCPSCMQAIKDLGIRNIYFTTDDGFGYERIAS